MKKYLMKSKRNIKTKPRRKTYKRQVGGNQQSLFAALENNDFQEVKRLVEAGADVNVQKSDTSLVEEEGADVNVQKIHKNRATPLFIAVLKKNLKIVKFLVENGADINKKTVSGNTILMVAIAFRDLEIVKFLLEKGADISEKSNNRNTPLHLAAKWGNFGIVKFLVEKGADINVVNKAGNTPLHIAAKWGNIEIVQFLIDKGANINTVNKNSKTPLNLAATWALATARKQRPATAYYSLTSSEKTGTIDDNPVKHSPRS